MDISNKRLYRLAPLSRELAAYCRKHNINLTPLRHKILTLIKQAKQPITAYAILEKLQIENPKAQAMSVYRVLDFLMKNTLIHRIERLSAFVTCSHLTDDAHASQWLICKTCGKAQECHLPIESLIHELEQQNGFMVTESTVELQGVCHRCEDKSK